MPNTKHLIELQILEKCVKWLEEQGSYRDVDASFRVNDFISYHFDADNNKEL